MCNILFVLAYNALEYEFIRMLLEWEHQLRNVNEDC
jgi:hypothetical protein